MQRSFLVVVALIMSTFAYAQDEKPFEISLHGFIAVDAAYNTRASQQVRNKHIYMFPLPERIDAATGKDLNDRGVYDMDAAHSRFGLHIKGPTINGVSVFGLLEADFLGDDRVADSDFRLRHAYVRLGYKDFSFVAGQTWHPFFIPENFPQTVNTGVGVPMHPLSRNPQLRFNWNPQDNLELSATLLEQNNFRTTGFATGSEDAGVPEVVLQAKIGGTGPAWVSLSAGYKRLAIPEALDPQKVRPEVGSFHYQATFRYKLPMLTYRMGALYGQNNSDIVIPGGVGRVVNTPDSDPEFKPLASATFWIDINSTNKTWDPGFFAGYLKAMGASEEVTVIPGLSLKPDVADVIAIAPRLKYHIGTHTWIGAEYMWTQAGWGKSYDSYGAPSEVENYTNHRLLLSLRYHF
jgi:hypothetical protein